MFRPIHFEIFCDDPARAIEFYTKIFGWEIKKWENPDMEYWMVMTAPKEDTSLGIHGGLMKRHGPPSADGTPVNGFVCTMDVPSVDEYLVKIVEAGGTIVTPKWSIAGMAWQAYCKDTEGNIFGIHQPIKNAA